MSTMLLRKFRMTRVAACFTVFVFFAAFQACSSSSSQLSRQQIAAYSVATGFLILCDDVDYNNALGLYAEPIKSQPEGRTWVARMQVQRAPFGPPIGRYWVNRRGLNEPLRTTFRFSTSFLNAPRVDEVVSVERISGKWQVYDYKFHELGKHPSPLPTTTPTRKHSPPISPHPSSSAGSELPSPERSPSEPPLPATTP
jgi:hypothetical protein